MRNSVHHLIRSAKMHFESAREVEDVGYLKPKKRLLIDITVLQKMLAPILQLTNTFFKALDSINHRAELAPCNMLLTRKLFGVHEAYYGLEECWSDRDLWSPDRPTIVLIGAVAIGLSIIELSEDVLMHYVGKRRYRRESDYVAPIDRLPDFSWTAIRNIPSGRFCIIAYSPYRDIALFERWQDTKTISLRSRIRSIVKAIEAMAPQLANAIEQTSFEVEVGASRVFRRFLLEGRAWRVS